MSIPFHDVARMPRTALVTGAGRRLGRAIALGLAEGGWDVAVHFNTSARDAEDTVAQVRALGRRACAVQADLSVAAEVDTLLPVAESTLGPIGCLVNSASRFEFDRPESVSIHALDAHLAPNLAAPVLLTRALHARLQALGGCGVVVNLLDQKLENLNPDFFSYTLSKAALDAATRMMARALAPVLRVASVSPGITLVSGDQTAEGFEAAHRMTPLGRSSRPEDIVRAVRFIAESPAISGVNLLVDGGQHLMGFDRDVMYLADAPSSPKAS